jgi:16S rRNA (cytosine967-C5)-methyltransferase
VTASPAGGPVGPARAGAPLGAALRACASVWARVREGQSLERALAPHGAGSGAVTAALDAAVRDICHDAMRRRALIDAVLARLVSRPAEPLVEGLLAAALSQILDRAYPDYAVVDQAVGAVRQDPALRAAAGFVNAVLREFLRQRDALVPALLQDDGTRLNVPPWWLQRMRREHPAHWRDILERSLAPPPMTLRVNRRRIGPEAYLERLAAEGVAARRVGAAAVQLLHPVPVARVPGFREGLVSVQDAGAQLAAPWLQAGDSMRVLDACAAPGGKTAHLAELSDARIDAVESDPQRAARIGENLQRLGLAGPRVRTIVADAARPVTFQDGDPYDRILLDAPCTGSGIVRRHADIPWSRRESDVVQLATLQARLLDALWPLLAPAGRLLYVVCSVFREEAMLQAESFLERHVDARSMPLPGAGGRDAPDPSSSFLQLLPSSVQPGDSPFNGALPALHDGFFYALFGKAGGQ